jgi:hypothetical protein
MIDILKYAKANVRIIDENGLLIFEDSNLFVDSGRKFLADTLKATISGSQINPSLFACDLGDSSTTPAVEQVDLVSYINISIAVDTPTYPTDLPGEPTGIYFRFIFDNTGFGGDQTIREVGLFYRPDSFVAPLFPFRGTPSNAGYMLARMKTTASSIVVGDTRTITIDWKIIF